LSTKTIIQAAAAPRPIGPYSVAVRAGDLIFTAGQVGLDPASGELVGGGIEAETRRALQNLENVLKAGGSSLQLAVKTTVFLRDMNDFAAMNAVYGEFFTKDYPARSTVQAAALPKGAAVEIDVVALAAPA